MSNHVAAGARHRRRTRRTDYGARWLRPLPLPFRRWCAAEFGPVARVLGSWPVLAILAAALLATGLLAQFPGARAIDIGGDRNSLRDRADVGRDDDFLYLHGGFHEPERAGEVEYRWTRDVARIDVPVVPGGTSWTGTLRLAGGRPAGVPQPSVEVLVDGRSVARFDVAGDWADYTFSYRREPLPPNDLAIELRTTTFTPPGDNRDLGVAVDRLTLTPGGAARPYLPPPLYLGTIVALLALAGALLARLGAGTRVVAPVLAGGLALIIAGELRWHEMTARYLPGLLLIAATLFVALLGLRPLVRRLFAAGGVALAPREEQWLLGVFTFGAAVHLAGVFFPGFQAHDLGFQVNRQAEVLHGDLLLSAISGEWGNRRTPYPPALYVLLAPFAGLVGDPSLALRLLPPLIDASSVFLIFYLLRRVGLPDPAPMLAAFCYTLVPATFQLLWWGFFPNLFGQWATLLTVTLAVAHRDALHRPRLFGALVVALCLTLLSHPGTFVLTVALIPLLAAVLAVADPANRRGAAALLAAFGLSLLVVYALYYSHFAGMLLDQLRAGLAPDPSAGATDERGWELGYIRLRVFAFPFLLYFVAAWVAGIRLALARHILGWTLLAILATALVFAAVHVAFGVWVRYFVFISPALAVGMGVVLARVLRRGTLGRVAAYAVLSYCVAASGFFWITVAVIGQRSPYP